MLRRGNKAQPGHGAAGAENADQLPEVFLGVPRRIALQNQEVGLTVAYSAVGARLVVLVMGLSMRSNRLP